MGYNILGITPGHNSSISLVSNGKLVFYLEEERLSRVKKDANPLKTLYFSLQKYKIDEVVLCGAGRQSPNLIRKVEDLYYSISRKFYPKVKFTSYEDHHHLTHVASSFYTSGFQKSLGVVIDAQGSNFNYKGEEIFENDSLFYCEYPNNINPIHKIYLSDSISHSTKQEKITPFFSIAKVYEAVSEYLNFHEEEGKTMGLSSYGKSNSFILDFLKDGIINPKYYTHEKTYGSISPKMKFPKNIPPKDIAWEIQNKSQQIVGDYIEKGIKETGLKQVCCSGGYFLNCVANYYLVKRFPDIDFYFDPISHDGGTSIGAALYRWHKHSQDKSIKPRKNLHNGFKYSKKELKKIIKKYL